MGVEIWRGETCAVINKTPGEDAEAKRDGWTAVNRLDTPVSGCLLLASTARTAAFLGAAFREGRVEKRYWAVVEPPGPGVRVPGADWEEWTHWIVTDGARNKSLAYDREKPGGARAVLRTRLMGRGDRYLFLEIELLTGRHHQIRAQLAARGFHVKGDLKYGARRSEREGGIRLHAASLAFPNPDRPGDTVRVAAPPPRLDALWEAAQKAAAR